MVQGTIEAPSVERRQAMTFEQFLTEIPEMTWAEWVDGEVVFFVPANIVHQKRAHFLEMLLGLYVNLFNLGTVLGPPTGMRTIPGRAFREPDLLFIVAAHDDRLTRTWVEGGADLVVEFVSEDSVHRDRVEKLAEYAAAGIPEYWILDGRDGEETADFFHLGPNGAYQRQPLDDHGRYHSRVLPGFWLDPAWLWRDPLPDPARLMGRIAPEAWRAAVLGDGEGERR